MPVEVDGRRFSVKVWLPERPGRTAAAARPAGRGPKPRSRRLRRRGRRRHRQRADAGHDRARCSWRSAPTVEVGQALLVLEAMKMENHISAEKDGTVAEIRVAAGDSVGTGDVLAVIE